MECLKALGTETAYRRWTIMADAILPAMSGAEGRDFDGKVILKKC